MSNGQTIPTRTTGISEKKLHRAFSQALKRFDLIEDGDKILIGLSGGKDSLVLTELLSQRMRVHKPKFTLQAIHITSEQIGYKTDTDYLRRFCEERGVNFETVESSSSSDDTGNKAVCFRCSRDRRKALFEAAERHGCNKIALGHQLDDVLETLFMNMTYHGTFGAVPPLLKLDRIPFSIIRPLYLANESDVAEYAKSRDYRMTVKECPHSKATSRTEAKELIAEFEKLNKNARASLLKAMSNINQQYLPKEHGGEKE
ncbi:MAG: adenine nucleotide alpha hydrolase family protein [Paludibacteraceae bacterium]|nr:adenine nucleotide alpha hydrolase family protein [Paludibacteraceae bacterium]